MTMALAVLLLHLHACLATYLWIPSERPQLDQLLFLIHNNHLLDLHCNWYVLLVPAGLLGVLLIANLLFLAAW